jgi:uncharacterized membrane protein
MLSSWRSVPRSVWFCIGVYIIVLVSASVFSYRHFFYAGLDLGIYDQVVWNTAHGRLFAYSFNPYSYLVDHREWFVLLLAPLYWVAAHPLTLLVVQTVVIASGAVPLYLLARQVFRDVPYGSRVAFAAALVYLAHPSVQLMNLFEFHMLPWVMPLCFWLWLCIAQRQWKRMWVVLVLLLLVREDVGLMAVGVGVLSMVTQRAARWKGLVIVGVSLLWFALMVVVGSVLSPEGTEKFFVFYDWLGNTPTEIVQTIVQHPLRFLSVLLDYDHTVIIVFLLMDVAFLAALAPRYLLPATMPLLLYLSLNQSMLAPVMKTHYAAVLVPWFMIAALHGYRSLAARKWFMRIGLHTASALVVGIVVLSQWMSRGPLWDMLHKYDVMRYRDVHAYRDIVRKVDSDDSVMASFRFYPYLSEREHLYSTLHTFTGKQHFADVAYAPPEELDWIVLEQEQILHYAIHLPVDTRDRAWERLQSLLTEHHLDLVSYSEDVIVFGHSNTNTVLPPLIRTDADSLSHIVQQVVDGQIAFDSWEYTPTNDSAGEFSFAFERVSLRSAFTDDYHIGLTWIAADGTVIKAKSFALGGGIEPTHMWGIGPNEQRVMRLPVTHPDGTARIALTVGRVRAEFGPFFTVWTPGPMFDPDHSETFELSNLFSIAARGK